MQSATPKVLEQLGGKNMLARVLATVRAAGVDKTCIVVNRQLLAHLADISDDTTVCVQEEQLGTGHALASAYAALPTFDQHPRLGDRHLSRGDKITCQQLLICPADIPALRAQTLVSFMQKREKMPLPFYLIAMRLSNPKGYGRLLYENGRLQRIVEESDATAEERKITLCNSGVMLVDIETCARQLSKLQRDNLQHEYYLTDLLELAATGVHLVEEATQFLGVNDQQQLATMRELLHTEEKNGKIIPQPQPT